ncbi:fumarylacetoacetate hydrolase family protein [Actinophytocola xanthii]|uniref:2-hydroxyhepta-2,4-diene-1,7-dioate isomerase n=1 Tax=Actinophytocola xanthii TaxID=1912961 RepID=A0A1Q8CAE5_9PSEU|nr:fumarylacetoacetate hydrolase family protein [Actinophytocola xanthii]OLF11319.1 2-hydroxyhepta-2,4-diene-1,7-dioate isomerase [Actinophytocola xanthii]
MKIVRYETAGGAPAWGVLDDGVVLAARGTPFLDLEPTAEPAGKVRLLAPVTPRTVLCVGRNYRSHAEEFGNKVPEEPLLFLKPPAAVVGPDAEVVYPALSRRLDPEAELVLVIGRTARHVAAADAWAVIGGYTCGNDITARDIQKSDGQWTRGKGFDTFCPIGPWVETDYDPTDVAVSCTVDGERRQDGRTKDLIFPIPYLIEYITRFTTLEPGDVILSGTPEGVRPVEPGNTITVEIDGLGSLTNTVVAEDPARLAGS